MIIKRELISLLSDSIYLDSLNKFFFFDYSFLEMFGKWKKVISKHVFFFPFHMCVCLSDRIPILKITREMKIVETSFYTFSASNWE